MLQKFVAQYKQYQPGFGLYTQLFENGFAVAIYGAVLHMHNAGNLLVRIFFGVAYQFQKLFFSGR
jgi:hypothetical protein